MPPKKPDCLKVAASSHPNSVASAIVSFYEEGMHPVPLVAIGAGAVNQMVKAVCNARGRMAQKGRDMYFTCGFSEEEQKGEYKTGIRIYVWVK